MKKYLIKILPALVFAAMFLCAGCFSVSASDAEDLADQANALGFTAAASGDTVSIGGSIQNRNAQINLNIPSGVTANWSAQVSGSVRGAYMLNLTGSGVFNFNAGGSVNNTGTGGQINAAGDGMEININGTLSTSSNGISLNIAANNAEIIINGTINNSGSNSAINVSPNITGVKITVTAGASVVSVPSGYAINDGGGVSGESYTNNTQITINGGTVEAGSACAIRSSGQGSAVTVNAGSIIRNSAASNTNSTIYMNGGTGDNIIINGGDIRTLNTTSNTSYVLQTTGNIKIGGSAQITSRAGRGINLVGMNSTVTIEAPAVIETESGIAVSTATTTTGEVVFASVIINGGTVRATGTGTAVRVTGAESNVTINDGLIESVNGNAIMASGADNKVDITGGRVSATSGNAVTVSGKESEVKISGGWVTATTGYAVSAPKSQDSLVIVSGGVVFAWGDTTSKVINNISDPATRTITDPGVVIAWNTSTGEGTYLENTANDLTAEPSGTTVLWGIESGKSGLIYDDGSGTDFFPINEIPLNTVEVLPEPTSPGPPYTLIVNNGVIAGGGDNTGEFYKDDPISITANAAPEGYVFDLWESDDPISFDDKTSPDTFFSMPDSDVTVTAVYKRILLPEYYSLKIINGKTNADLNEVTLTFGSETSIKADAPPYGMKFIDWINISGGGIFDNASSAATDFMMPRSDAVIAAHYEWIEYPLTVIGGTDASGLGHYHYGEEVTIIAEPPPEDKKFSGWTSSGGGTFKNQNSETAVFVMPAGAATVTANYEDISSGGYPSHIYPPPAPPQQITASEEPPPAAAVTGKTTETEEKQEREIETAENEVVSANLLNTGEHILYIRGTGGNLFEPNRNTTRAEAAQMFYNLLANQNITVTKTFPDIPEDAWYAGAVNKLASLGIFTGFPNGEFRPEAGITRAEFVTVVVRAALDSGEDGNSNHFDDVPETHWAYSYINAAVAHGWIQGYGNNRFAPDQNITRAETVTLLNRVLNRHADKEYIDNHQELTDFSDVSKTHWAYYDIMEAFHPHIYERHIQDDDEDWETAN
ncbi:MAG: S-layer homology domain-containing protein [Oscillospiraceae bacterium]|nr:S-layer homology domain-containing protein [Oscillospiraceae bacterium]